MILRDLIARISFQVDTEGLKKLNGALDGVANTVKALGGVQLFKSLGEAGAEVVNSLSLFSARFERTLEERKKVHSVMRDLLARNPFLTPHELRQGLVELHELPGSVEM